MIVTLDIETIPVQDADLRAELDADAAEQLAKDLEAVRPPANYKKEEAIAAFIQEKQESMRAEFKDAREAAYRKTALDGALGSIAVVGLAFGDGDPMSIDTSATSERDMLKGLMHIINEACTAQSRPVFAGHNLHSFDLPFLWKRCVINRVKPSPWLPLGAKAWDQRLADTMLMWDDNRERRISLDNLCKALGAPTSKGDLDGSKVGEYWAAGRYQEVIDYCLADVEACRQCYRRMTFQ